jgi:hypothetical protein
LVVAHGGFLVCARSVPVSSDEVTHLDHDTA